MARPGRMRFEYDPPSPILLIADRFYVYYVDKQLAQMSKVGLKSTPAWFLLRDPITFDDLLIKRFERGANTLTITVVEPAEPDNGSLTIVFSSQPLASPGPVTSSTLQAGISAAVGVVTTTPGCFGANCGASIAEASGGAA